MVIIRGIRVWSGVYMVGSYPYPGLVPSNVCIWDMGYGTPIRSVPPDFFMTHDLLVQ